MKAIIMIVSLISVLAIAALVPMAVSGSEEITSFSWLVLGADDAAGNTDAQSIVNFSFKDNCLSVIQIPRDTACSYNGKTIKINALLNKIEAEVKNKQDALSKIISYYADNLGIKLFGATVISTGEFVRFIDDIGGVYVHFEEDFLHGNNLSYNAGESHISGKDALRLVRHRSDYPLGDLDRLDVQKIFIKGFINTCLRCNKYTLIRAIMRLDKSNTFGDGESVMLSAIRNFRSLKSVKLLMFTLPGKAIEHNGVSFYQICFSGADKMLSNYFSNFYFGIPKNNSFLPFKEKSFFDIYYSSLNLLGYTVI